MKNIIIFYQSINRELDSCLIFKKKLKELYKITAHVLSIDFEHYKAVRLSKKIKIDMLIIPWMYQESNYALLQPILKQNQNMIIVNLHHEQIGSEASYGRLLPTGENAKNSVIHFVWGEFFEKKLIEVGVKKNFIFKTGNIRTDTAFTTKTTRQMLAREFKLDPNKVWILFAENRGWILTNNSKKEEHMVYLGYTPDDVKDRTRITKESLDATINEFNELDDDFFNDFEIIYRPHPGTNAPENINKRIKIIDKYSIYEWINSIDVNVVWTSTSIFESDIKNIPSFVYEPIKNLKRHRTSGLEYYPKINRFSDLNKDLIIKCKNKLKEEKIYERYLGKVDGKSIERSCKVINKLLNNRIDGYSPNLMPYDKYGHYKRLCFQLVTKLLVRLKLLDIFKYPRSAYELRKDIPYGKKIYSIK